ncbi:MAG TPA: carboxypeptidase-like regulatory domain-containing protein [Pyrinomonadaceae bacterium]|nr:carboxypeptidase-like regulatory domain-containing protein [Pyrinomonadaceae bacterium]
MLKIFLVALLPVLVLFGIGLNRSLPGSETRAPEGTTGILRKMIVASGTAAMDLNMSRLGGVRSRVTKTSELLFDVERDSFFTVIVFNDELRAPLPSSMRLIPQDRASLPSRLAESYEHLIVETMPIGSPYELTVRDGRTGFTFFNIEGHQYDFTADGDVFNVRMGRMLLSDEFARALGQAAGGGSIVGQISIRGNMRTIEVTEIMDGEVQSSVLKADPEAGTVPGPDVVVGDLNGLAQFGSSSGTQVGLAVGTDSCNFGTIDLNWFQNPSNDHPVIPQNMYRMSGGPSNDERFEQIGQSSVKHAFTALTQNLCALGCNGVGGSRLGSGCSDPYSASLNAGPNLGSRAWINPYTGFYPRNDSATPNNSHTGHTHVGPSHRILTEISDLATNLNPGATYFAEGQYITPHEYVWCQSNPTQCNMNNNVSYRQYNVSGTGSPFAFSPAGSTQRAKAAIRAWPGSQQVDFRPDPSDGIGTVAYKVTNPSPGVWRYEYAVYNQNLDRAISAFSVPVGAGVSLNNLGFHAPPQHPGWANDGTVGSLGFSNAPWVPAVAGGAVRWSSETFAQNQNANALRWGTLYNFRFESNRPPATMNVTLEFFKTGGPITVQVQGPSPVVASNVSISGRVTSQAGRGLGGVYVLLRDAGGNARQAITNPFGYYTLENVLTGQTYTIGAVTKRYTFPAPGQVVVNGQMSDLNFVSAE